MNTLVYNEYSDTIRQAPQNYLIAYRREGKWIADPDLAADKGLAVQCFTALLNYENRWQSSGHHLLERIKRQTNKI